MKFVEYATTILEYIVTALVTSLVVMYVYFKTKVHSQNKKLIDLEVKDAHNEAGNEVGSKSLPDLVHANNERFGNGSGPNDSGTK